MFKHTFVALLCSTIMACASGPAYKDLAGDQFDVGNSNFYVGSVSVALQENLSVEHFPNIHELHIIFQQTLEQKLAEAGLAAQKGDDQSLGWHVLIDYRRLFETLDEETPTGLARPEFSYRGTISRFGSQTPVASYLAPRQFLDKGALGKLEVMGGGYAGADPDEEQENINVMAEQMVDVLLNSK